MKRVAILHYSSPPTVGGVELTVAYQARGLADLGYPVRVISGTGAAFDERVDIAIDPLFGSAHPEVLRLKTELDAGQVSPAFKALVEQIRDKLKTSLLGCDVCIVHNALSLHKNLPLTAALASLDSVTRPRLIAWCDDIAWTNSQYRAELHNGYPWELLCQPWPGVRYVTISAPRRDELANLFRVAPESIAVVEPGVDPARFWHWTQTTRDLESSLHLLDADGLLLLPARLTRRKNIELALRVLAEARRQSTQDFRLVVTGPPGPHNPTNAGYLGDLIALRHDLQLDDTAHFLYTCGDASSPLIPDDDTLTNLYQLSDALLFPSTQEGFGIPILEAGLASLPIFCADIPALRHTGQEDVSYFDPVNTAPLEIANHILEVLHNSPVYRLRVRSRHNYRWDRLIRERLIPLLEET